MADLPREVWKWLQSLRLTTQVRNPRRDLANGFVVAEILCRYFPDEVSLHSYHTGTALDRKLANWQLLSQFFPKKKIDVPQTLIYGTIHCKPGAVEPLIKILYAALTHRKHIKALDTTISDTEFQDLNYQASLPSYARSTASCAVKYNLKPTEVVAEPNTEAVQNKAETIIATQQRLKQLDRAANPDRYGIRPIRPTGHKAPKSKASNGAKQAQPTNRRYGPAEPEVVEVILRQSSRA